MATPSPTMPLQDEVALVNYIRGLTGTGAGTGAYTASQAQAAQAPLITQEGLSGIMTEWLRGSGQFLDTMRQQNVSGLYNTSTRRLLANDLTAQAALKAATANQNIGIQNAQLATQAAMQNAQLQSQASAVSARTKSPQQSILDTLLAAGIAAYKGDNKGKKKDEGKVATTDKESNAAFNVMNPAAMATPAAFDTSAMQELNFGPQQGYNFMAPAYESPMDFGPQMNYGFQAPDYGSAFDFGPQQSSGYDFFAPAYSSPLDFGPQQGSGTYDYIAPEYESPWDYGPQQDVGSGFDWFSPSTWW